MKNSKSKRNTGKKKKNNKFLKVPKLDSLKQINLYAAGIDIGSSEVWVCVPENQTANPVQRFASFTHDFHSLANWLKQCNVETVAMESTGVYWIPVYDILEEYGFDVYLVNAKHIKNVPGKKTDILDCQWIQQLHTYGLLSKSFIPVKEIRCLRDLCRHRDMLINYRASHIHHMQKAMHLMNIQLDNVISDITGKTGLLIIRAIVSGKRDPKELSQYRDPNCRNTQRVIEKSLEGTYKDEYVFQLKQSLELYDFYSKKIVQCNKKLEKKYQQMPSKVVHNSKPLAPSQKKNSHSKNAPDYDLRASLYNICGVDLTAVDGLNTLTVQTVISEIGVNMEIWPSSKHFTSWLCVSPYNDISGGKVLRSKTRKTTNKANLALRQAAQSLHHSNSYLGAFYRRMRARLGAAKATTATAHKLARIIYVLLKEQKEYSDLGVDYFIKKNRERELKKLMKHADRLGYTIVPTTAK